ncbi:hypothetical protein SORDD17_00955 [Streptococcus oralis]|uniref:Low temperature requirement protein A n=1 Tax=Streptococcus oralis TaxID=1303 RepID=A0A139RLY0_STROR|nr:low temperature requirement protein A [Streptococcus oralis]KXU15685.1 hypothetical protein SORDD17_00955 [Streptococcus oralis]
MSSLIKHKRVEFSELFYDLVFVYAISKTTALIHHLHHGVLGWESILSFLITLIILINSWMIQTVFTNRYGKNSLFNMVIMFINMAMLLLISNMITADWQGYFYPFSWAVGTLSFTLFFQYLVEYLRKSNPQEDRPILKRFLWITGLRFASVYLAALLPLAMAFPVFLIGILGTFLLPLTLNQTHNAFRVNFPHLIERISLLVIITFGEMVMGLANFFTPETFSLSSVLYFILMILLFLFYFGQFDHAIDEGLDTGGVFLIYSHYPIFIGLILITVSMSFLQDPSANALFATTSFYLGIGLVQLATLANGRYNKDYLRYPTSFYALQLTILLVSYILSLLLASNTTLVIAIATLASLLAEAHSIHFYMTQVKKHAHPNWDLF